MLIVSEEIDKTGEYYLDKYIIFTEYDNIIKKVKEVIDNYDYYYNLKYKDFNLQKIQDNCKNIIHTLRTF